MCAVIIGYVAHAHREPPVTPHSSSQTWTTLTTLSQYYQYFLSSVKSSQATTMPKRLGDDHSANTQRPQKHLNWSAAPALVQEYEFTPTDSPTLRRPITATKFPDFTPANENILTRTDIAQHSSTPLTPSVTVGSHDRPTCFRISGIPSDWSTSHLKQKLQVIDPELNFSDVDLSGPFPSCCDSTHMALLHFDNCTAYFQRFKRNDETLVVIREDMPERKVRLIIDKHFYDLTPMNYPDEPIITELVKSVLVTCSAY